MLSSRPGRTWENEAPPSRPVKPDLSGKMTSTRGGKKQKKAWSGLKKFPPKIAAEGTTGWRHRGGRKPYEKKREKTDRENVIAIEKWDCCKGAMPRRDAQSRYESYICKHDARK